MCSQKFTLGKVYVRNFVLYSRDGPSINFLGPGKRFLPAGSLAGCLARKVYVYVVFPPLWAMFWKPQPHTTCRKRTAVHLQFVRQYASHLHRRTFLASSSEERETLQYASHLYCSTPPIYTAVRPPFVSPCFPGF